MSSSMNNSLQTVFTLRNFNLLRTRMAVRSLPAFDPFLAGAGAVAAGPTPELGTDNCKRKRGGELGAETLAAPSLFLKPGREAETSFVAGILEEGALYLTPEHTPPLSESTRSLAPEASSAPSAVPDARAGLHTLGPLPRPKRVLPLLKKSHPRAGAVADDRGAVGACAAWAAAEVEVEAAAAEQEATNRKKEMKKRAKLSALLGAGADHNAKTEVRPPHRHPAPAAACCRSLTRRVCATPLLHLAGWQHRPRLRPREQAFGGRGAAGGGAAGGWRGQCGGGWRRCRCWRRHGCCGLQQRRRGRGGSQQAGADGGWASGAAQAALGCGDQQ